MRRVTKNKTSSKYIQSSKLGGSPKPVACKIVHGRIKLVVPQVRRACEKKSHIVSKVDFIRYCV